MLGVYDPNDTTYGGIETGAELDTFKLCNTLVLILEVTDCVSGMTTDVLVICGINGRAVIKFR